MSTRVIVTGSRKLTDRDLVHDKLTVLAAMRGPLTVVHGGCPTGADKFATEWVAEWRADGHLVDEEIYTARWDLYGKAAGPFRNEQMVLVGADLLLAFMQSGERNTGTSDCVLRATRVGIPTKIYTGGTS